MELAKIATRYLKHCGIKISAAFVRERVQSHYPAFVSLIDFLVKVSISGCTTRSGYWAVCEGQCFTACLSGSEFVNPAHPSEQDTLFNVDTSFLFQNIADIDVYNKAVDEYLVNTVLQRHEDWTKEAMITHTPTIFMNSSKLPKQHCINDLNH